MTDKENKEHKQGDKLTREELGYFSRIIGIIKRRDPQLAEWLQQFCSVTGMKIHEVIIHALRSFRVQIEAGEILRQLNAEDWNKLKMAILYDMEIMLKIASHYHLLFNMYFGEARRIMTSEASSEVGLKRAYKERIMAFKTVMKAVESMIETNREMIRKFEDLTKSVEKLITGKEKKEQDGQEKT